jgi:hypothetical protein
MFFGATAFSQAPFASLPEVGVVYAGVLGMSLAMSQNRVIVDTPFNINATAQTTGVPLQMAQGSLGATWIQIDTDEGSIWTPIAT